MDMFSSDCLSLWKATNPILNKNTEGAIYSWHLTVESKKFIGKIEIVITSESIYSVVFSTNELKIEKPASSILEITEIINKKMGY